MSGKNTCACIRTEDFTDVGVVHVWTRFQDLPSLLPRPHHECIHWSFDMWLTGFSLVFRWSDYFSYNNKMEITDPVSQQSTHPLSCLTEWCDTSDESLIISHKIPGLFIQQTKRQTMKSLLDCADPLPDANNDWILIWLTCCMITVFTYIRVGCAGALHLSTGDWYPCENVQREEVGHTKALYTWLWVIRTLYFFICSGTAVSYIVIYYRPRIKRQATHSWHRHRQRWVSRYLHG